MNRLGALVWVSLWGCSPAVSVGSDTASSEQPMSCERVATSQAQCPPAPWGSVQPLGSTDELQRRLLGRWAFCGGEKRYTGRGELAGFPHGTGVEFWSESGALRYAFLVGVAPAISRATEPQRTGVARLVLDGGRGQLVLVAGDGLESPWRADFFDGQPVLQNGMFDVWNFVRLQ